MQGLLRFLLFVALIIIGYKGYSQPQITTDTVIQTSLCAGSNVIIPFTVIDTGGTFNFGNVFTAQLSNNLGFFTNPVDIGVFPLPWTTSGFILGTIPIGSPIFGIYKVRVVGSNPVVVGSESINYVVIINTAILATINSPDSIICEGDSVDLTATPIFQSYQWERNGTSITGAASQTYTATQSGSYTVTVIDTLGCETTSEPFNVYVENCIGMNNQIIRNLGFSVFPNPVLETLTITSNRECLAGKEIAIYNAMGQVMIDSEIPNRAKEFKVNTLVFPPGIYTIKLRSVRSIWVRRFIKI
ncbi:MAG TPA: T9SS type A sorting domain-containing protein [Flavobacteriales bacterium]|nr:T9SS type A sorting domain-containing protein [Flavobacteriales bacterium]HIN38741.1 T9SS type A sorting domain-containing protein [Flavobacteriales bacterium]